MADVFLLRISIATKLPANCLKAFVGPMVANMPSLRDC